MNIKVRKIWKEDSYPSFFPTSTSTFTSNLSAIVTRGVQNRIPGRPESGNPDTRFFGHLKMRKSLTFVCFLWLVTIINFSINQTSALVTFLYTYTQTISIITVYRLYVAVVTLINKTKSSIKYYKTPYLTIQHKYNILVLY